MTTSAKTLPNYGMRPVGGFGIRGWRAHCDQCGYLSRLYTNIRGAQSRAASHVCEQIEVAA